MKKFWLPFAVGIGTGLVLVGALTTKSLVESQNPGYVKAHASPNTTVPIDDNRRPTDTASHPNAVAVAPAGRSAPTKRIHTVKSPKGQSTSIAAKSPEKTAKPTASDTAAAPGPAVLMR